MRRICKRQTRKLVLLPPIQENVAAAIVDRASPPGERHQAWFTSVVTEGIQEATVASKVSATEETRPDEF